MSILIGGQSALKAMYIGDRAVVKQYVGSELMWKKSRLPEGYQEVEWLKGDGYAYIDTQMYLNERCSVKVIFELLEINDNWQGIFGSRSSATRDAFGVGTGDPSGYPLFADFYNYNTSRANFTRLSTPSRCVVEIDRNKRSIIDLSSGSKVENNTRISTIFNTPTTALLFGLYNYQSTMFRGRMYLCEVLQDAVFLRRFVPCYRTSDGVPGMYDMIGSVCSLTGTPFYVNAGTGSFTKGADINVGWNR